MGQNVNSYGKNLEQPVTFAELLSEVVKIDGIRRVRFMTSHPKDLSDELIRVMASSDKICRHLHLPLQSGSTRILTAMNRRYTKEQYLDLVERIRDRHSGHRPDDGHHRGLSGRDAGGRGRDHRCDTDVCALTTPLPSSTPNAPGRRPLPWKTRCRRMQAHAGFDRVLAAVQETARGQVKRLAGKDHGRSGGGE